MKYLDLNLSVIISVLYVMGKVLLIEIQVNVISFFLSSILLVVVLSLLVVKDNKIVFIVVENILFVLEMFVLFYISINFEVLQFFVGIGGSIVGVKLGLIIFYVMILF